VAVQFKLQGARNRLGRRRTARKVDRAGYRPLPESEDSFWRMKLLAGLASGRRYHSDSNPDYQPWDDVEEVDEDEEDEEEQAKTEEVAGDSSFSASATQAGAG
jgi:hypothetical protein